MKPRFVLLIVLLIISSCTLDHETEGRIDSDTITIEEAMKALDVFLTHQLQYSNGTRSSVKKPHSILTVTSSDIQSVTRSSCDEASTPLVYVVNYENDGGFAILAANTALPDPVIAVTEKGNLSSDLSLSRNGALPQAEADEDFSCFIKTLIVNYIERERTSDRGEGDGGGEGGGTGGGDDTGDNPAGDDPNTNHPGGSANPLHNVAPLFPNWWAQDDPFNRYCYNLSGVKDSTGCLPLALSMSLTHYCKESNMGLSFGNRSFDFDEMSEVWYRDSLDINEGSSEGIDDAAYFIFSVGCMTGAYGYGIHPTMQSTKDFLQNIGFTSASVHNSYDLSQIIPMLQSDKPVIISGFPALVSFVGHAWIIDGIMEYPSGFTRVSLVHCNWGEGGAANGYYTSGVFTPMDGAVCYDENHDSNLPGFPNTLGENYQYYIKFITY